MIYVTNPVIFTVISLEIQIASSCPFEFIFSLRRVPLSLVFPLFFRPFWSRLSKEYLHNAINSFLIFHAFYPCHVILLARLRCCSSVLTWKGDEA